MPIRRLEKTYTGTSGTIGADELTSTALASVEHVKPHIQPGTLQPAVAGKLLDGSTSHSGAYGTAQADGFSYYYTDIKGSKPIKDLRIGAHFGSQRHMFYSVQKLEQETGIDGIHTYSIDGRENCRASQGGGGINVYNDSNGNFVAIEGDGGFIEVVGYFNDFNLLHRPVTGTQTISVHVNGVQAHSALAISSSASSPLTGRYVSASSVRNIDITSSSSLSSDTALGINTIKFTRVAGDHYIHGCEFIVQDTTSTATKSKIQIPAQNVVSYGKKFSLSAAAHHYDPFNGFTNSSHLHSAYVDTATSLGLDSAPGSSASWTISSTNNIRPYNGGRVVKWIASDGTIKTSVTMMPPNAQNINTTASAEIATPSATNTTTTPNMSDDAVDHSLSEVAKTFHWREFGNGKANRSSNSVYRDASMLSGTDDIVYVMDDGLTSLIGNDVLCISNADLRPDGANDFWGLTCIGTGITITTTSYARGTYHIAQNLPYGTHILKTTRDADTTPDYILDGIAISDVTGGTYACVSEITIHQPKMPPIPDDACIIADYMLMADFVRQAAPTVTSAPWDPDHTLISKGVRMVSPSRDIFYEEVNGFVFSFDVLNTGPGGYYLASSSSSANSTNNYNQLPAFGTDIVLNSHNTGLPDLYINGVDVAQTETTGHNFMDITYPNAVTTLGNNIFKNKPRSNNSYAPYLGPRGYMIVSPIHTSSHYQTFETPFLRELVGGDRNMEQTNLVVTADGKSWDEVTRDMSYISDSTKVVTTTSDETSWTSYVVFDKWRGEQNKKPMMTKDFAIAYDRLICLVEGMYHVSGLTLSGAADTTISIQKNGTDATYTFAPTNDEQKNFETIVSLIRGDYIQLKGEFGHGPEVYNLFSITRLS